MKSELSEPTPVNNETYPKLRIFHDGSFVVLFSSSKIGSVVWSDESNHKVGSHLTAWAPDMFSDFNGKVILEN